MDKQIQSVPVNEQDNKSSKDFRNSTIFAILAYLGILVLVPIFAARKSNFVRFHANQGLVLFLAELAWGFASRIVIRALVHTWSWSFLSLWSGLSTLVYIGFSVFAVIGIINAVQGSTKPMPFWGRFRLLK